MSDTTNNNGPEQKPEVPDPTRPDRPAPTREPQKNDPTINPNFDPGHPEKTEPNRLNPQRNDPTRINPDWNNPSKTDPTKGNDFH